MLAAPAVEAARHRPVAEVAGGLRGRIERPQHPCIRLILSHAIDRIARALVLSRLRGWQYGRLELRLPDGTMLAVGDPGRGGVARAEIHDNRAFTRMLVGGSTGAGEAYMDGQWSSPNLRGVLNGALANAQRVRLDAAMSLPRRLCDLWRHTRRRNTHSGSEQNIHAHYDLGNEFFQLFLDESLAYSCAIWDGCDDLGAAQQAKFDLVCRKLDLAPGDRVLEIGCGWGGFAIHAARTTGCRIVGITVSREQYELASQRVAAEGLDAQVRIVYSDYRDIEGTFDKVVSIEMFEAVGREYWDEYFATCERVLRPGGTMLLQTIGIQDRDADSGMRASGWISKYIFPGGVLPAVVEIRRSARRGGRALAVRAIEEIGPHYVRTLDEWRRRFWQAEERVRALGFDDRFIRMWDFYLASCAASFETKTIRDVQVLIERAEAPGATAQVRT
ncbi:MAG: class I SAM-dependent methyltransferase [Chloroflexi bacterium]|nr:class I SAM-dependent methyltransferase [Chloroflexota bacterium]